MSCLSEVPWSFTTALVHTTLLVLYCTLRDYQSLSQRYHCCHIHYCPFCFVGQNSDFDFHYRRLFFSQESITCCITFALHKLLVENESCVPLLHYHNRCFCFFSRKFKWFCHDRFGYGKVYQEFDV